MILVLVAPIIMSILIASTLSDMNIAAALKTEFRITRPAFGFGIPGTRCLLPSSRQLNRRSQQQINTLVTHRMLPKCYFNIRFSEQFENNWLLRPYKGRNLFLNTKYSIRQRTTLQAGFTSTRQTQTNQDDFVKLSSWKGISIKEKEMMIDCTKIIDSAIDAVDPVKAVRRHLSIDTQNNVNGLNNYVLHVTDVATAENLYNDNNKKHEDVQFDITNNFQHIYIISFGKASSAMSMAVVDTFVQIGYPMNNVSGYVICKDGYCTELEQKLLKQYNITICEASHPIPDVRAVTASFDLLNILQKTCTRQKTLVIACISGGGSSLFCTPHPTILQLDDLIITNKVLLQSGLSILDMNVIRKRLEQGKGGRLAATTTGTCSSTAGTNKGTSLITLVLSDVIGDPLDLIASGPTVPDTSSWSDAWKIVQQNEYLKTNLPLSVMNLLQAGYEGKYDYDNNDDDNNKKYNNDCSSSTGGTVVNSPSANHPIFQNRRSNYCLVGNNRAAVYAAADMANDLGYIPIVLGTQWQGEASTVATVLISMVEHILSGTNTNDNDPYSILSRIDNNVHKKSSIALIVGGETTVTIPSDCTGIGGRNQELALAAGIQLNKLKVSRRNINVVIASIGTDGTDGPTDAAGAIINSGTISRLDAKITDVPKQQQLQQMMTSNEALQNHDAYNYFNQIDPIEYNGTGTISLDKVQKVIFCKKFTFEYTPFVSTIIF
jgi:glycerate 2-kinase